MPAGETVTNRPPRADDPETLAFYDRQARAYAGRGGKGGAKMLARFMERLPGGARVLDLGSGDGRRAQTMEQAGFDVSAIDGSAGLAAIASRRLTKPVRVQTFDAFDDEADFDAVWAQASLVHVPLDALPDVLARVHRALAPGGLLYASFKTGGAPGRDQYGRYYNRPGEDGLRAAVNAAGRWDAVSFEHETARGYDDEPADWLLLWAIKAGG